LSFQAYPFSVDRLFSFAGKERELAMRYAFSALQPDSYLELLIPTIFSSLSSICKTDTFVGLVLMGKHIREFRNFLQETKCFTRNKIYC
jgi:hypothetical protein